MNKECGIIPINRTVPILLWGFIILSVFCFAASGYCAEESKLSDKDKLIKIFKETVNVSSKLFNNPPECKLLIADLQENKNYELVEPIVQTDDYKDPKLQYYLGKCSDLPLQRLVLYEPRLMDFILSLPPDEREKYGQVWNADGNFKLYRLSSSNMSNDSNNYIFYAGCWHSIKKNKQVQGMPIYSVIYLQKCKELAHVSIFGLPNCADNQQSENFSGVIKYKSKYYIFEVSHDVGSTSYHLSTYKLSELATKRYQVNIVCVYDLKGKGELK